MDQDFDLSSTTRHIRNTGSARWPRAASMVMIGCSLAMALVPALADGGRLMPRTVPDAYASECASCHIAFPPALLPARSWQRMMGGLDKHFGSDASLDAATVQQLSRWLQANAGSGRRVGEAPPQDRITRSAWFERKHRQIDVAVWNHTSVKSPGNCAACHTAAQDGRYDDDELRVPHGLPARLLRAWND